MAQAYQANFQGYPVTEEEYKTIEKIVLAVYKRNGGMHTEPKRVGMKTLWKDGTFGFDANEMKPSAALPGATGLSAEHEKLAQDWVSAIRAKAETLENAQKLLQAGHPALFARIASMLTPVPAPALPSGPALPATKGEAAVTPKRGPGAKRKAG